MVIQLFNRSLLAAKGTYPPFPHTANQHLNNPIVELPVNIDLDSLLHPDAVLLTHLHVDHFDDEAKRKLAQDGPIYTQSEKDRKEVEEVDFSMSHALKMKWTFAAFILNVQADSMGREKRRSGWVR